MSKCPPIMLIVILFAQAPLQAGPPNPAKRLESAKNDLDFIKQRRDHYSDAASSARADYQSIKDECDASLQALLFARDRLKQVLREAREKGLDGPAEAIRPEPKARPGALIEDQEPDIDHRLLRIQYQTLKHLIARSSAPRPDMARRMMEMQSELNRAKVGLNHPDVSAVLTDQGVVEPKKPRPLMDSIYSMPEVRRAVEDVRRAEGVHRYNVSRRYTFSRSIVIASGKHKSAMKMERHAELAQAHWQHKVAEAQARTKRRMGGGGGGNFGLGAAIGGAIVAPIKLFGGGIRAFGGGLFRF